MDHQKVEQSSHQPIVLYIRRLIYIALTKQIITHFKPAEITKESRQQAIRAYCPNIFTVNSPMLLPVWQNAIRKVRKWLSPGMPYELWHMKCATISPRPFFMVVPPSTQYKDSMNHRCNPIPRSQRQQLGLNTFVCDIYLCFGRHDNRGLLLNIMRSYWL